MELNKKVEAEGTLNQTGEAEAVGVFIRNRLKMMEF